MVLLASFHPLCFQLAGFRPAGVEVDLLTQMVRWNLAWLGGGIDARLEAGRRDSCNAGAGGGFDGKVGRGFLRAD